MFAENAGFGQRSLIARLLPLLLAVAGFLLYLLTLNGWISLANLGLMARISGWLWRPDFGQPLTVALFFPFRCLPETWVPVALNLFTAGCAAGVLALLARSVSLLPYYQNPPDKKREFEPRPQLLSLPSAWIPPVLAAVVCGLELSFWEHATSATGEIVDLLVFAYVLRCLLEFRVAREQKWLTRSAFVYGLGMANNWLMIAYLPVYIFAVLRSKSLGRFLKPKFLLLMAGWGLAGVSLYLLLPTVHSIWSNEHVGFWKELKTHLRFQKGALGAFREPAFRWLALSSLAPFLVLSIRWTSHTVHTGDDNILGILLARATGHFVHGLMLVMSLWIALDPLFSPRHRDLGTPMLTYYYISALAFGYCVGYFLLLGSRHSRSRMPAKVAKIGTVVVCVLPVVLLWKNLGQVRITNGPALHEFARELYSDLPMGRSVVLSDDILQSLLLKAELVSHRGEKEPVLLDSGSLGSAQYLIRMASRYQARWPVPAPTNRVETIGASKLLQLIDGFVAQEPVFYLHPNSGLFYERFREVPNGFVHRFVARKAPETAPGSGNTNGATPGTGMVSAPAPMSDGRWPFGQFTWVAPLLDSNQKLWETRWVTTLQKVNARGQSSFPAWARPVLDTFRLQPEGNFTLTFVNSTIARALDDWGVQLQRNGHLTEAGTWFERAFELDSLNLSADINVEYNRRLRQGTAPRMSGAEIEKLFPEAFRKYPNWREVLANNGPIDEPAVLVRTGRILMSGGNPVQAAEAFVRSAQLAPEWAAPKLWLALVCNGLNEFNIALEMTGQVLNLAQPPEQGGLLQLLNCRATALQQLGRTNAATAFIEEFLRKHPDNSELQVTAAELYARNLQFEDELRVLEELLKRDSGNLELMAKKGLAQLQLARYDAAIATLSQVLATDPSNDEARLQRALAYLGSDQLEAARSDYNQLLKTTNAVQNALFGLGSIAWRQQDTNTATQYYQQFLAKAVPQSPQYTEASERLRRLKQP
jgi:tetratricopeptide (TPR) repeat protein